MSKCSEEGGRDSTWQEYAACRDDPELFFTGGDGKRSRSAQVREAKAICHRCPVEAECLAWALRTREKFGVLGGKSESERNGILRRQAREARRGGPVEHNDGRDTVVIDQLVQGVGIPGASKTDRALAAVRVHVARSELSHRQVGQVVGATKCQVRRWLQRAAVGQHPLGTQWLERERERRTTLDLAEVS